MQTQAKPAKRPTPSPEALSKALMSEGLDAGRVVAKMLEPLINWNKRGIDYRSYQQTTSPLLLPQAEKVIERLHEIGFIISRPRGDVINSQFPRLELGGALQELLPHKLSQNFAEVEQSEKLKQKLDLIRLREVERIANLKELVGDRDINQVLSALVALADVNGGTFVFQTTSPEFNELRSQSNGFYVTRTIRDVLHLMRRMDEELKPAFLTVEMVQGSLGIIQECGWDYHHTDIAKFTFGPILREVLKDAQGAYSGSTPSEGAQYLKTLRNTANRERKEESRKLAQHKAALQAKLSNRDSVKVVKYLVGTSEQSADLETLANTIGKDLSVRRFFASIRDAKRAGFLEVDGIHLQATDLAVEAFAS